MSKLRVLFVCMGNICRSPTAEGVFHRLLADRGLTDRIEADSAGTIDYHAGRPPDRRAQAAASRRGVDLSQLRARRFDVADFERFDVIVAMDHQNLRDLQAECPSEYRGKLRLLLEFADGLGREVPDPYLGDTDGFEHVLDLVEAASEGLIAHLQPGSGG